MDQATELDMKALALAVRAMRVIADGAVQLDWPPDLEQAVIDRVFKFFSTPGGRRQMMNALEEGVE